ncbi:MAG: DUF58 domain-containing protein [Planctomycetes bacterium]|nr:DUF58 domain-containing protein [Planctomycetota bacterium]
MSKVVPATMPRRPRWYSSIPALMVALVLGLGYSRWTVGMTLASRIMFRAVVVLFAVIGVFQIASALSPTRGTLATPGFGKHRMVVPVEGIVYLTIMFALFTGAMLTKSNMLLLVFALMAGPFVINGWMTFGMLQSARVTRTAPPRAMVGELFNVELMLSNSRPLMSIWIMSVRDTIQHAYENLTAVVLFARVAPRSSQVGHYQLKLMRRGRYQLGPLLTYSRFPLGLVERSRLFPLAGEVLIYPRIGRLGAAWRRRWLGATELVARPQPQAGVFHDEFHRLREFRTGDNPRDIHWRTSARRGELILREYQQNRDFNLSIILDLWQPDSARKEESRLIEQALSFAATAIVEHGRGCRDAILTLSASGATTFRWQGQGTSASLESLFDGLAVMNAGPARDTMSLVDDVVYRSSNSTQIVLLTTRSAGDPNPLPIHNPRIDMICLPDIDFERALIFEEPLEPVPDTPTVVSRESQVSLGMET